MSTSRRLATAATDNVQIDADLKLVTYSRHSNQSRGVVVLYLVSNLDRAEPSADLFVLPSDDYKSVPSEDVSFHFPQPDRRPKTED